MKVENLVMREVYEAKVPIEGKISAKMQYQRVIVVGVGDSYYHGNAQMVAVLYKNPLSPRGLGIALISPTKIRMARRRIPPK